MELTTVSLIISAIVALVQVFAFLENRHSKKENKMSVFVKASDVEKQFQEIKKEIEDTSQEITNNFGTKIALHAAQDEIAHTKLETCQAVLKERIDNTIDVLDKTIDGLDKIDQKTDKILERI